MTRIRTRTRSAPGLFGQLLELQNQLVLRSVFMAWGFRTAASSPAKRRHEFFQGDPHAGAGTHAVQPCFMGSPGMWSVASFQPAPPTAVVRPMLQGVAEWF